MKSRETGNSPTTQFVIRFSEDCPREKWNDITCECGLSKQARRTGVPNEKYSVYRTDDVCEAKAIVDMMRKHNYIDYGAEAVCLDNLTTFATDRLVAAFPAGATQAERDAVRKLLKSEKDVKVESSYDSSLTLRLGDPKKDIEEIASDLQGRIRKAGFPRVSVRSDSVILYNTEEQGAASASERTSFEESQAALQLIEAYGAQDLLIDEPAIRIAIIDSGFDDEHPDLKEVKVRLEGRASNRDAYGARVKATTGDKVQVQELISGVG